MHVTRIRPSSSSPRRPARGFTLIELLTVIAIIGILAAILIPVVGKVRETARFSKGISNMREWSKANLLYANDHKGNIPHDGGGAAADAIPNNTIVFRGVEAWWNALPPYLGVKPIRDMAAQNALPKLGDNSIFVCPNASHKSTSSAPAWLCYGPPSDASSPRNPNTGYITNLTKVANPSRTVMFAELTNHAPGATQAFPNANPRFLATQNRWGSTGTVVGGKSIVGFYDGSVRNFTGSQLQAQGANSSAKKGSNPDGIFWDWRP